MNVSEMIAANKRRQNRARELNHRSGQMDLFKAFSLSELVQFVAERLGGAKRQVEIIEPERLLLPELDEAIVAKVLNENPDDVVVCGRTVSVQYGERSDPLVRIDFRGEYAKDWLKLPEDGVRLPGGREVVLYSAIDGYGFFIEAPSSKFPSKARECLNAGAWLEFEPSLGKPIIELPDPAVETSEVPLVREHQYGTCAITNEALLAFGTVAVKGYRYSTDSYFEVKWFRGREEAESVRSLSVDKLLALKRELAEQKVVAEARVKAEKVKAEALLLYRQHNSVVGNEVADRLYRLSYEYLPQDLHGLQSWIEGSASVLVPAKALVAEDEVRRNRPEIREVRIDRRGQYRKPELNGTRIDSRESFRFTPDWFWDDLLGLVEDYGRSVIAFAIYRGKDPLVLAMSRTELEALVPAIEQALKELGGSLSDEAKISFWRKLEGMRPKRTLSKAISAPCQHEQVREYQQPTPKKPASGGSFGLGADAWGALDGLKL